MSPEARDDLAVRSLDNPAIRFGMVLAAVVLVLYGVVVAPVVRPVLLAAIVAVELVFVGLNLLRPWERLRDERPVVAGRLLFAWQLSASTVGIALVPVFLVYAIDVEVAKFAPIIALAIVSGAYSYPSALRLPLLGWSVAAWMATLLLDGVRDPRLIAIHGIGMVLVAAISVYTADARRNALEDETRTRTQAEQYTQLLAGIARANSLERREILDAVVTGLLDTGLEGVAIWRTDRSGGHRRLVVGTGGEQIDEVESGAPDGEVVSVPLRMDATGEGLLVVASRDGPLTSVQRQAAQALAEEAGHALERADAFASDQRVVDELQRLEDRTQDFVSTVSHELRTPLTVIDGLAQTLGGRWEELDEERRRDLLERVRSNAERLRVIVDLLLDTTGSGRDTLSVNRADFDLAERVRELVHRLATITAAHPVSEEIPDGIVVSADANLFDHVVENLLTNVAKHTPQGTGVWIRARQVGDEVEIEVADDGPGIPEADLPHVLDRFYRGGDPTRRTTGGLGLGLALAHEIVLAHGGELDIESGAGQGTTFYVRLPAAAPR